MRTSTNFLEAEPMPTFEKMVLCVRVCFLPADARRWKLSAVVCFAKFCCFVLCFTGVSRPSPGCFCGFRHSLVRKRAQRLLRHCFPTCSVGINCRASALRCFSRVFFCASCVSNVHSFMTAWLESAFLVEEWRERLLKTCFCTCR